jgi:hypothetical protein
VLAVPTLPEPSHVPARGVLTRARAGLHIFLEQGVDVAVLEVGLGGRLDATNVVRAPAVCGVASLGFDHMEVLRGRGLRRPALSHPNPTLPLPCHGRARRRRPGPRPHGDAALPRPPPPALIHPNPTLPLFCHGRMWRRQLGPRPQGGPAQPQGPPPALALVITAVCGHAQLIGKASPLNK